VSTTVTSTASGDPFLGATFCRDREVFNVIRCPLGPPFHANPSEATSPSSRVEGERSLRRETERDPFLVVLFVRSSGSPIVT